MNRILKRQLKRNFGKDFDISSLEPKVQELLASVEETYEEFTREKALLENTLDINSTELYEANQQIVQKNENLNSLLEENSELLQNRIEENLEIGTQLKQYKQAMDSALLVNTFDLDKNITFVNNNYAGLSGFTQHELIGQKYDFLHHQESDIELQNTIFNTIQNKEIWNGLLKYQSRDLQLYDLNATIFPILNANNETTEYMSIFQDITAIENSRKKAIELEKAKSLFIANMSHELRTPLNSIIGFSQILQRQQTLPEKSRNYIDKINSSGEHLLKLINSILDFSKIEAGQVILEHIKINLYSIINTTLTQLETQAKEKNILLKIEYEKGLTKTFLGDSLRLTQIITNLVSNSIKFTNEGYVKIIVRKIKTNRIQIEVQDSGIGLNDTDKNKLFEEFSQADNSTTREYGGTGLGLSISKELVQLMDGTIWVESEKGKGSSFIFEIELEEVATQEDMQQTQTSTHEQNISPKSINDILKKTILLVEDNPTNQLLITTLFEDTKIKIDIANNGLEALNMIKSSGTSYDLILMDLQMPVMNGFEATIEIRKNDKTIPIIALSANVLKEDIEKTHDVGMNEYLRKPIDTQKLYNCLVRYLV